MKDRKRTISRRHLLKASAAAATLTIIPRHVLGGEGRPSANERLNIAAVGVGGMGSSNLAACADENIVALCDVDLEGYAVGAVKTYPDAKVYKDFRVMLDQQKDIDAVIVATPDHSHAVVALAAIRRGKHVYVQKPLAHSIYEARVLTEEARKHKLMTQMGNQGHSGDGARLTCEWIADGAIGSVREVHCWTNRPVWPQSIEVERPRKRRRSRPRSTGTSGSVRHPCDHTTPRTIPARGGRGGTSARGPSGTWAATSWTRRSGL
jgi:predicted dehydrogenase